MDFFQWEARRNIEYFIGLKAYSYRRHNTALRFPKTSPGITMCMYLSLHSVMLLSVLTQWRGSPPSPHPGTIDLAPWICELSVWALPHVQMQRWVTCLAISTLRYQGQYAFLETTICFQLGKPLWVVLMLVLYKCLKHQIFVPVLCGISIIKTPDCMLPWRCLVSWGFNSFGTSHSPAGWYSLPSLNFPLFIVNS